jgi:hypothetical protein
MAGLGRDVKTIDFLSVAATFETASTYVFAERLIRNAGACYSQKDRRR